MKSLVLFDPYIGLYQVLSLRARENLEAIVIKGMVPFTCIPHSSSITGASPSDYLVSYLGHSLGKSYPSAEMQSVYSVALADRV